MAKAPSTRVRMPAADTDPAELDPSLPQKRRARHRLIGAVVLCLAAAVLVPMLLSPEPTRGGNSAQVVIQGKEALTVAPSKPGAAPVTVVSPPAPSAVAPAEPVQPQAAAAENAITGSPADRAPPSPAVVQPAPPEAPARADPPPKSEASRKELTDTRAPAKEGAESRSVKGSTKAESANRILLQVGSFRQTASAQTALDRVKGAGLKGYSETIETERGERIRVRVGPFASREAAEQARAKLKSAGLEAVVVSPQ